MDILFKKHLDELRGARGEGTSLITVLIPPGKHLYDARAYLAAEAAKADNIKSNVVRKNVKDALSSILSTLNTLPPQGGETGVALLFGVVGGVLMKEVVYPPSPIPYFAYRCGSVFFLEPLYAMTRSDDSYGVVVLDLNEASIGIVTGTAVRTVWSEVSGVPNKHKRGGQSAARFERLRDDAINNFFKRVGEAMTDNLLAADLKGIIVGGPAMTKDSFLDGAYIHHELRKLIAGVVNTSYTDDYGVREAVRAAGDILAQAEFAEQKRHLDRFFEGVRTEQAVAYGVAEVSEKLERGQVDILLLSDRMSADDIEAMSLAADGYDTEVVVVSTDHEQGDMFDRAFRCGAILRY